MKPVFHILRRRLTLAACAALAVASLAGGARAAETLFLPATAAEAGKAAEAAPGAFVKRSRIVRLGGAAEASLRKGTGGGDIVIDLFPGVRVVARAEDAERSSLGNLVWSGRAAGGAAGDTVVLVVDGDAITGSVQTRQGVFSIRPLGNGLHRIDELATNRMPEDIIYPAPEKTPMPALPQRAGKVTKTKIDVLVAYTDGARDAAGGQNQILAEVDLAVKLANRSYEKSGVPIVLGLVGTAAVEDYSDDTHDFETMLDDITKGALPQMAAIHKKRNKLKADLVSLLREGGGYCGLAWLVEHPSAATSDRGFSVVARGCIDNKSFAHELGHNMGLNHDRYVAGPAPNSAYNFGYVNLPAKIRTIMAYNNRCDDAGFYCERIPLFSTPKKTYKTFKIGIPQGKKGAADAVRTLTENREGVAAYRAKKKQADAPVLAVAAD